MYKTSLLGVGVAGMALGLLVSGCYTQEQLPGECVVRSVQSSPYFAELNKTGSTGMCTGVASSDLTWTEIGASRLLARGSAFDTWRYYFRISYLTDVFGGGVYQADTDTTNNCSATSSPGKCVVCVSGTAPNLLLPDGGAAVDSSGTAADGGLLGVVYETRADGGIVRVNLANRCGVRLEGVERIDPTDPTGANINLVGKTTSAYPDARGVCRLEGFTGGVQNVEAAAGFPAITLRAELSNVEVINTVAAPATYFTANLALTEGACTTNYQVKALWPVVECDSDADCNPVADLDAGKIFGSGISPDLKPKCNTAYQISGDYAGVCTPTVEADALKF